MKHLDNTAFLQELGIGPRWRLRAQTKDISTAYVPIALPANIEHMDWPQLTQAVHDCQACPRAATRQQAIISDGDSDGDIQTDWLFITGAPDAQQDQEGSLRAGSSARLLDNMLAALDLRLGQQVYLTSAVKCHAESLSVSVAELAMCHAYLARQIVLRQPKVIVALGAQAAATLLSIDANTALATARGSVHRYADVPVIVTHAPADVLQTPAAKAQVWADLCLARQAHDSIS